MPKFSNRFIALLVAAFAIIPASWSRAWIDTGHKIIAFVAWDELTPKTRTSVLELLSHHPRYDEDLLSHAPQGAAEDQIDRHVFAMAATWPDMVRFQNHPMHAAYSHPAWHYIDILFLVDGQPAPEEKKSDEPGPKNIVEALQKCTGDLKNEKVSPADKAISLCWVIHLVGDIHQPLHTASMVSPEFPYGDKGGNSFIVLRDPPFPDSRSDLHLIWDELPGQFKSEDLENYEAQGIRNDPRFSRDKLKDALAVTDFFAWAKESQALAVQYAYLNGELQGITAKESHATPRLPIPGLPQGYIENAEQVTIRQLALAGHRLADLLNASFDVK